MNILKKTLVGTGILALIFSFFAFLPVFSAPVAAAPNFNLKFADKDGNRVSGTYNGSKTFTFTNKTTDPRYQTYAINTDSPVICNGSSFYFTTSTSAAQTGVIAHTGQSFSYKPSANSSCSSYSGSLDIGAFNGGKAPAQTINWSGAKGTLSSDGQVLSVTFSDKSKVSFYDRNVGDSTINFKPQPSSKGTIGSATVVSWCDNTFYGSPRDDSSYGITLGTYKSTSGSVKVCYDNGSGEKTQTATLASIDTSNYTPSTLAGSSDTGCAVGADLNWIICPVITGMSDTADAINGFVESQLNFNTKAFLGTTTAEQNGSGSSVQRAWTVFRDLTSIVLVIVLLVVVIAQAGGGNMMEAYTIKKIMPKLVIAIIFMQISWAMCIWFIQLSNDAGQGVAGLMSAPFGGLDALSLPSLLGRLSDAWGIALGVTSTAGLIAALIFSKFLLVLGWPMVVLAIILILISLVVGLATILVRNALIVLLVIVAPLALLSWVLPGTQKFWNMWKENFSKLLVFFMLVELLVYGGRIFAWIAANLGAAGPLDAIMVIVGFFGPYFFLPKTFKWGGSALAMASKGINESWPIKKSREAATKGLMERQQNILNRNAKALDPSKDGYAQVTRRWRGIPIGYKGKLGRTMLENVTAGRMIPTKRELARTIKKGDEWSAEEDAIAMAKIKREQDKAVTEQPGQKTEDPTYTYSLDDNGNVVAEVSNNATARGKAALFRAAGRANEREAGVAAERALRTSSWVEMGKNLVPVEDEELKARIKASGAEWFEGKTPETRGKLFVRMYDLPRYNTKVNSMEDLYPLPMGKFLLATPHIGNPEGKTYAQMQASENATAQREGRPARQLVPMEQVPNPNNLTLEEMQEAENEVAKEEKRVPRKFVRKHHLQRAVNVLTDYLDAGNITSQSEAEFGELARLAKQDPDVAVHFGDLLHRIAMGGQGGINVLTQLNSSASMRDTIKKILAEVPENRVQSRDIEGYLNEGKRAITGQPPRPGEGPPDSSTTANQQNRPRDGGSGGSASPPGTFRVHGESTGAQGTIVNLQHGTSVPPAGVGGPNLSGLERISENLADAALHMRRAAATQERAARRISNQPSAPRPSGSSGGAPEASAPRQATWKGHAGDQPVRVIRSMGRGPDGREYFQVEGSDTGVPGDELDFEE